MSLTGNVTPKETLRGKINDNIIYTDTYQIAVRNGYKGTVEEWLAILEGEKQSQGRSAKYSFTSPGWKRVLNIIRASNGTITMGLVQGYDKYMTQAVAIDFTGFVKYGGDTRQEGSPVIYQRYNNIFGADSAIGFGDIENPNVARITKVRIAYPEPSEDNRVNNGTSDSFINPINCYVDIYVDFHPENISSGSVAFNMNYSGFADSHNCGPITEETDAAATGIYGERLVYSDEFTLEYYMGLYMPNDSIHAKRISADEAEFPGYVKAGDGTKSLSIPGLSNGQYGFKTNSAGTNILPAMATNADIDARTSVYKPIVPNNLEYAVQSVGNQIYVKAGDGKKSLSMPPLGTGYYGFKTDDISERIILPAMASNEDIDARTNQYKHIVPNNLEYAVQSVGDHRYVRSVAGNVPDENGDVNISNEIEALADRWSSKNIVDKLCQSFTETGSMVTCQPVEGYPLGVVTEILSVQEGEGDPSPDNIRPIAGLSSVNLWHGGKNLVSVATKESTAVSNTGDLSLSNIPSGATLTFSADITKYAEDDATFTRTTVTVMYTDGTKESFSIGTDDSCAECDGVSRRKSGTITTDPAKTIMKVTFRLFDYSKATVRNIKAENIQLEVGAAATDYEQYRGQTLTMDLGQNVYSGSLDWQTGVLTVTWRILSLNGQENWTTYGVNQNADGITGFTMALEGADKCEANTGSSIKCSHTKTSGGAYLGKGIGVYVRSSGGAVEYAVSSDSLENISSGNAAIASFKNWLAAQASANTPVQICYPLATPITVQLEPQEILALSGVNTLYADTGEITVTGRTDPNAVIEKLTNAIIALGGNV